MAQTTVSGWAAHDSSGQISPFVFDRRENGENDVTIEIKYCGICHSDLHRVENQWDDTNYPCVPGHEITGVITKVGSNVAEFSVGDRVGVGALAMTCLECEWCLSSQENYCDKSVYTYNSIIADGSVNKGGYSKMIVMDYRFVVPIPDKLPLDAASPLLCAGVAVFRALKDHDLLYSPSKKIGVVGLGGLGHLAVKFAKACGHHVTVISSTPSKEQDAIEHLGANDFILSTNSEEMERARKTIDFIIYTVSAKPHFGPILHLLNVKGAIALLAEPAENYDFHSSDLIFGKRSIKGSVIGSMQEIREMLELCAKFNIVSDIEIIAPDKINNAFDRMVKNDVKFRFVIDIAGAAVDETSSI